MKQIPHCPLSSKKKKKSRNFYYATLTKTRTIQSFFNDEIFPSQKLSHLGTNIYTKTSIQKKKKIPYVNMAEMIVLKHANHNIL